MSVPHPFPLHALIVEDDPLDAELLLHELRRSGFDLKWQRVDDRAGYLEALASEPDIIYCDFNLPQFDGLRALDGLREAGLDIPFIIVSGAIGEDRAVEVMRRGAWDYLLKDRLARIGEATRQALEKRALRQAKLRAEEEARSLGDMLQALVDAAPLAIAALDAEGRARIWNPAAERLFGWRAEEVLLRASLPVESGEEPVLRAICGPDIDLEASEVEGVCSARDGSCRHVALWNAQLHGADGRPAGTIRIFADISERRRQQERIDRLMRVQAVLGEINATIVRVRDRPELFREACRIASEHGHFSLAWIGMLSADGSVLPVAAAGLCTGMRQDLLPADMASGSADLALVGEALGEGRIAMCNQLPTEGGVGMVPASVLGEARLGSMAALPLRVEGTVTGVFAMYAASPGFFTDDELHLLNEMAADVSFALDYIAKAETVSYLAYYDPLTGLPNRQLLQERIDQFIRTANPAEDFAAVIAFDPERFRILNDSLGRQAGDELLRAIAERIRSVMHPSDTPARLAGDAFAVFLGSVASEGELAHAVERRLLESLADPFHVGGEELRPTIRPGIAMFPVDGRDADTLLRNAEAAQKRAKAFGEKYLFYAPEMNARVSRVLALENKLRRAMENGEFVLYYQPKVDLQDGSLVGVEALLRWRDPEGGLVPPARITPLLEETGLILDVGRWALQQAVIDRRGWQERTGRAPRVAVNVSSIQLLQKDFLAEVERVVGGDGAAGGLDLEITETVLMKDFERSIGVLEEIRRMGVAIAIDDFGTGYSSLSYLSRLPVELLKIDYSFIKDMVLRPEGLALVSTVITLGHTFKFHVIAEGVETEEQARLLRLLKCDEAQGFLFSAAVPAEEIERRLHH